VLVWSPVASRVAASASTGRPSRPAEDPGDQADNHTTIIGNLVDDPEVRFTNNGTAVTNVRVAPCPPPTPPTGPTTTPPRRGPSTAVGPDRPHRKADREHIMDHTSRSVSQDP